MEVTLSRGMRLVCTCLNGVRPAKSISMRKFLNLKDVILLESLIIDKELPAKPSSVVEGEDDGY